MLPNAEKPTEIREVGEHYWVLSGPSGKGNAAI